MSENTPVPLEEFPTELLVCIFKKLLPKNLATCRQVCVRFRNVVDSLITCTSLWKQQCRLDFPDIYKQAYMKRERGLIWSDLYRSLTLWSKLKGVTETRDEFASASCPRDEVRDFQILEDGIIGVHTRGGIFYYSLDTLTLSDKPPLIGDYLRYVENNEYTIILGFNLSLLVTRKIISNAQQDDEKTFDHVKLFIVVETKLFFVNLNDEVHLCDLSHDTFQTVLLKSMELGVMSLGYSDDILNILTFQRDIYSIESTEVAYKCTLASNCNLLHELKIFNFLENLDWRVYFQWMYVLNHTVPHGPLRDIIIVKSYGKVTFVGSNWGVLRIYYNPYLDDKFDIFNTEPMKQYNFMERCDCPVLSMCPIIQIDALEGFDSHKVIVAMPKKIAILTFKHNLMPMPFRVEEISIPNEI